LISDESIRTVSANVELRRNGDVVQLVITERGTASVEFRRAEASWNMSSSERLEFVLHSRSARALEFQGWAENADAKGASNCVWTTAFLNPDREMRVRLPLTRRPVVPPPFGTPKYPGTSQEVKVEAGTVMPESIAQIGLKLVGAEKGDRVDLIAIEPAGTGDAGPVPFFPFVDTYGQYIHREWPGKIHDDEQLRATNANELSELNAMPDLPGRDRFGGWKDGPRLTATGHFRAEKNDARWWLVTPDGTLFFSFGPVGVRSTESGILTGREQWFRDLPDRGAFAEAYIKPHGGLGAFDPDTTQAISFLRANLIRKYGQDWQQRSAELARLRLRKYGFNTIGNWSEPSYYLGGGTPYTVAITPRSRMLRTGWNKFPDVFDPGYEAAMDSAAKDAAERTKDDEYNIGYFVDNELGWGWNGRGLAEAALDAEPEQPSKVELLRHLRVKYGTIERLNDAWQTAHASWEALAASQAKTPRSPPPAQVADLADFQKRITDRYFRLSRDAVRRHAPNKLYLGCRMANYCGTYPDLFARAAEYCDVVSFNIYRWATEADDFAKTFDNPIIIGEFGYWPSGVTPFNEVGAPGSFPDRGTNMIKYVDQVLSKPNFVGCHLYLYADQVVSGRGDGEAQPTGLVTVTDQPKRDLFDAARTVADRIYQRSGKP
jgi:hypothetical protein